MYSKPTLNYHLWWLGVKKGCLEVECLMFFISKISGILKSLKKVVVKKLTRLALRINHFKLRHVSSTDIDSMFESALLDW